jgi:hypothetical protein
MAESEKEMHKSIKAWTSVAASNNYVKIGLHCLLEEGHSAMEDWMGYFSVTPISQASKQSYMTLSGLSLLTFTR